LLARGQITWVHGHGGFSGSEYGFLVPCREA
jgi:hypothetical protein